MKKTVLTFLCSILALSFTASAQVYDGFPLDSTTVTFSGGPFTGYLPDTATVPLWQIGHGHKAFFGTDTVGVTMMTDTVNSYPKNANNWFVFKINHTFNTIVDFWHKYQSHSGHAGGIVEFSLDHGVNWQNVKGACNIDGIGTFSGVHTTGFYGVNDTLFNGEAAFMGTRDTMQYSRFQFFDGFPIRISKGTSGCTFFVDSIYFRFRFVSDTSTDTLAGWEIDSIKIEHDEYSGSVTQVSKPESLHIYPNPSYDGTFVFPALNNEQNYTIEVYNTIGERVFNIPYTPSLNLTNYPKGLYFYKVSDGTEYFSGRLLIE